MELIPMILSAALFALASNLDTWLLALVWGLRGARLSPGQYLVITGITTAVTWLALALGARAADLLPTGSAGMLGALVLVAMGLWTLLDWLRSLGQSPGSDDPSPGSLQACVPLAAALAVNNSGMGAAAGVAGLPPAAAALANLAATLFTLQAGLAMGRRAEGSWLGRYGLPLSGVLLVALGALQLAAG